MQTRVADQPAFILRRRDWRDTSLILDLFTRDYGCIHAIAKGARRKPAKAPYQPFEVLSVGWSGRQDLKTLTAIEGYTLAVDERNYLALLYVNELIGLMLPEHEADVRIFARYLVLLQAASDEIGEAVLREFELDLMRLLGYFPDISVDAQSSLAISARCFYQFVINRGFMACEESSANSVSGGVVLDWIDGGYDTESVRRLAKSVLRSTIDFNLHGKKLKSRDVYQQMMKTK